MLNLPTILADDRFVEAYQLQVATHVAFHERAGHICGGATALASPPPEAQRIERNFFSTLFLAVTALAVGPSRRLPLYAMVNQGMRAWVTACDNLLDDEYKEIFPLPAVGRGPRMRSVLTLLLADRIVVEYALDAFGQADLIRQVGRVSLAALMSSAVQESEEEARPATVLPPAAILADVHARKTGDLFVAPLALPVAIEDAPPARLRLAATTLRQFGLACQILDDINDLAGDLAAGRHNLLASILWHEQDRPADVADARREPSGTWAAAERFPEATRRAWSLAQRRFSRSLDGLARLGVPTSGEDRGQLVRWMAHLLRVPVAENRSTAESAA